MMMMMITRLTRICEQNGKTGSPANDGASTVASPTTQVRESVRKRKESVMYTVRDRSCKSPVIGCIVRELVLQQIVSRESPVIGCIV